LRRSTVARYSFVGAPISLITAENRERTIPILDNNGLGHQLKRSIPEAAAIDVSGRQQR
jgi:hypothetical protein